MRPASAYTVGGAIRIQSAMTYSGGTPGQVISNEWNYVSVGANVDDYVWSGVDIMDNSAPGGNNVARYMQSLKRGAGPTWASVIEMRNYTDVAGAAVAVEVDVFGNGSVNKANRIGIDLVIGKNNPVGSAVGVGVGIRIGPQDGDPTRGTLAVEPQQVVVGKSEATDGCF